MPSVNEVLVWLVKRISALTRTATDADLTDSEYMAVDNASAYTRKITVASLATWVLSRIKRLATTITSFRTGDVIPVDGPNGPAKMPVSDLQDAILGGPIDEIVQQWLDEHPEATTTVQDGSLTEQKFSDALKLKAIKDYVTPEMFGAKGDGVTDDTSAINAALAIGRLVIFTAPTYIISNQLIVESNTHLIGYNSRIKVKTQERIDGAMLLIDHKKNVVIEGLIFDENMAEMPIYDDISLNTEYNVAIKFTFSSNLLVKNCVFDNLYNISIDGYASSGVIDILDNTFKSLVQLQGYMASHISLTNITAPVVIRIANNQFLNDDYDDSAFGVCAIDASNITNGNVLIENNRLVNCGRDITYTHRLHPIDFYTNVSNATVRGNYIKSRFGCCRLDACKNIVFEDNVVDIELPTTTNLSGDGAFWIVAGDKVNQVPRDIVIKNNVFTLKSRHYYLFTLYNAKSQTAQTERLENIVIEGNVLASESVSNYFIQSDFCVKNIVIRGNKVNTGGVCISLANFTTSDSSQVTAENITIEGNDFYTTARDILFYEQTNKSVKNITIANNIIKCSNAYGIITDYPIRVFGNYFETAINCRSQTLYSFGYDNLFYDSLGSQSESDFLGDRVIKRDNYTVNGTKLD